MIPLSQYIEHRIEALNHLDREIARLRESAVREEGRFQELVTAVDNLQVARNVADRRLFDLFSLRSAKLATPEVTAPADEAWSGLLTAWRAVLSRRTDAVSAEILRISDLLEQC